MTNLSIRQMGNRGKFIVVSMMILISAVTLFLNPAKSSYTQATWIWNAKLITEQQEDIIAFAKANGINMIYLHVEQKDIAVQQYRSFIKAASLAGIKVDALGGDPYWALAANQASIGNLIAWVKEYNKTAAEDEQFHGIHVDIEPYLLPRWKTDRESVLRQWMENIGYAVHETKKDAKLAVSADLPFWVNTLTVPGESEKVSSWMIRHLDSITLMAYRNYAHGHNGIVDIVQGIMNDANEQERASIIVGVNIMKSSEGKNVSFHKEGTAEMKNQLTILQDELSKYNAFAGSAIHDYESWRHVSKREEKL